MFSKAIQEGVRHLPQDSADRNFFRRESYFRPENDSKHPQRGNPHEAKITIFSHLFLLP